MTRWLASGARFCWWQATGTNRRVSGRVGGSREVNPRARFVEIAGAAHAAHQKCPDTVREVISDFLAEVDNERAGSHGAVN